MPLQYVEEPLYPTTDFYLNTAKLSNLLRYSKYFSENFLLTH